MNSENPAPALGSHLMMSGVQITETDGTSFAVTRATGEVALLQPIESGLSISHMRAVLLQSARGLDSPGRDLLYRQGLIDFQQAVDELSTSLE